MSDMSALQIRTGQQSIIANLWPLTGHIYHVMMTGCHYNIMTGCFPRNLYSLFSKAAVHTSSSKQVLLEILQYSKENICVGV